jgi:RNA recognition motif-containing protein
VSDKLHVSNLHFSVSEKDLRVLFEPYGTVLKAYVNSHLKTGAATATAFIEMSSHEQGDAALAGMDGRMHDGRPLRVEEASVRQEAQGDHSAGHHSAMFESMNVPDRFEGQNQQHPRPDTPAHHDGEH